MPLDYISAYATDNGGPFCSSRHTPITKRRIDLNLYQSSVSSDRLSGAPGFLPSRSARKRLGGRSPPYRAEFRLHGAIPSLPAFASAKLPPLPSTCLLLWGVRVLSVTTKAYLTIMVSYFPLTFIFTCLRCNLLLIHPSGCS